jgi:hypothetical protein
VKAGTAVLLVGGTALVAVAAYAASKMLATPTMGTKPSNSTGSDQKAGGGAASGSWIDQLVALTPVINSGIALYQNSQDDWGTEGVDWKWSTSP